MRRFIFTLAAVAAVAPAESAPPITMSAGVQQDVRCFMLFAAAVDQAGKAKNEQARAATSLAVTYYLGKLTVEAPTLNLVEAVRQEAATMDGSPRAKAVGAACDAEFSKRGQELVDFGQQLQKSQPQSSSSSS